MHRRSLPPVGWLLALLLGVALLSGCLSGEDSSAGPPADPNGDSEPADDPDRLAETVESLGPFVEQLPEVLFGDGGAVGYVLDGDSYERIEGAQVIAQCQREGLSLPTGPQIATTDDTGRFLFDAGGSLDDCTKVTYQALKPGYVLTGSLSSGQLDPGTQYLVILTLERLG